MMHSKTARTITAAIVGAGMLFGGLPFSPQARADTPVWSHFPSDCRVDPFYTASTQVNSDGSIQFAPGTTGFIVVECSIPEAVISGANNGNTIIVNYADPDGTGTDYEVFGEVDYEAFASGSWAAITNSAINSNTSNITGRRNMTNATKFTHTWNASTNLYRVYVYAHRDITTLNPVIYGVQVLYQP